jgi:hypothetical protein
MIVKEAVKLADKCLARCGEEIKYFPMLAKVMHAWRDVCRPTYISWIEKFGARSALDNAKSLPPKCQSGRWGSVVHVQRRLLACGMDRLRVTLGSALQQKTARHAPAAAVDAAAVGPSDDPAIEESIEYSKRMGRWRQAAFDALQNVMFGIAVKMMDMATAPLEHHAAFCHRRADQALNLTNGTPFSHLILGKARDIMGEFEALFEDDSWALICAAWCL